MCLAPVLTRAQSLRFRHPLTRSQSHIRQLHDALGEANGGVAAALRGCRNTGARSKTRAPVVFYGTRLIGVWYENLPARVWPSTNALILWCAPSAGARLPRRE